MLTGQPEQTGIRTRIKCDTERNFLAKACDTYDVIYPVVIEGFEQHLDSCKFISIFRRSQGTPDDISRYRFLKHIGVNVKFP